MACTGRAAGQQLVRVPDVAGVRVHELPPDEVVDGELDCLFGRHADELRQHARVEAAEALVADDFSRAVERVCVEPLADALRALILHARLDQVDGVDHEGAKGACNATEGEVVDRVQQAAEKARRLCKRLCANVAAARGQLGAEVVGALPRGIEDLCKVGERQPAAGLVEAGKVEDDVGLHGGEEGEAGDAGGLVEEVCAADLAVVALVGRVAHNQLDEIHLADHVVEGAHVCVRNLAAGANVAERLQVLQQVV